MRLRQITALIAFGILAGCGSGSEPISGTEMVTRDTEPSITQDALILAAGISDSPWLTLATAQQIDADLKAIRATVPALIAIGARGDADPKRVTITLKSDAPWKAAWKAGTLTTGNTTLDAALTQYRAVSVKEVADFGATAVYSITFDQWLNTQKLSAGLKPISESIAASEVDGYVGDGNDIEVLELGQKYQFRKGWGDCLSGCTSKHYWTVTKSGTSWQVEESGAPI